MEITSFRDLYLAELQELVSVEEQLSQALRRCAGVASHPSLKHALMNHGEQTLAQRQRLIAILQGHGADPNAHSDQAMRALIQETDKMVIMLATDDLRDAGLIASLQRLEHYEIAAYGTVTALAGQLGLRNDQKALHESLDEERQADIVLTRLAKGEINQQAVAA